MAKSLQTDAGTLIIPNGYARYQVASQPGGLSTTGVLMLIGEADAGPDFTLEDDLEANAFGPDDVASVVSKYKSGALVDAFKGASSAANDPEIVGSFSRAVLLKTNVSGRASVALTKVGGGAYETLADKSYGDLGNLIQVGVSTLQAEVVPTTGAFTFIPPVGTVDIGFRVNGDAVATGTIGANDTPTAAVATINGLTGVAATGGASRGTIAAITGTLTLAVVSGNAVTITRSVAWDVVPTIGDTLIVPQASAIAGGSEQNVGAYVVTGATSLVVSATKLSDAGKVTPAPVIGTITAPFAASASIASTTADLMAYSPVVISNESGVALDGIGKTLEIGQLTTGTDLVSRTAYVLGTTGAVSWVSTVLSPVNLASSAEYKVTVSSARSLDNVQETFNVGGEIALKIGYEGTSGTITITDTDFSTTVVGGAGASIPSKLLSQFRTIQSIADYINSQTGYTASVGTAALGLYPSSRLDNVTAKIASEFGAKNANLKIDAYRFATALNSGSVLVQVGTGTATQADAGLPAALTSTFMSGGSRGATTNAIVTAALLALESIDGNFVVPLFSRDSSLDIADNLTDIASVYDIAAINAAVTSHVLAMSTFKRQRNRQGLVGVQDTFANQKAFAANTASFRINMPFQNPKAQDSAGNIVTFQPWMLAVKAASMQAAGFYRAVENKGINITGLTHNAGDFNPKNDSDMEDALLAGLMPAKKDAGYRWVSDQTTWGADDSFVYNSLQALYVADTIALTLSKRMGRAFVGKSVADISVNVAMTYLENIMSDFLRLKLIAVSDDAKKGYKNARIRISGNAMLISVEVKLAGTISFVVIDFLVSPVSQTA